MKTMLKKKKCYYDADYYYYYLTMCGVGDRIINFEIDGTYLISIDLYSFFL